MGISSERIGGAIGLLCLVITVMAADPPFPHIGDMEVEFYQTEVQVTVVNQQGFGVATEYFDNTVPRGKVELKALGNTQIVFYNNATNEILQMNETYCEASNIDESIFDYQAIFYGWFNKDPLVIGPSAGLWLANTRRNDIVYAGKRRVRKIQCDAYTLDIKGSKDNVTLTYYFADTTWKTPFQMDKMRVPIRIEAKGETSRDSGDPDLYAPVDIITDFAYFRPTISDWLVFQPPLGIGCPLKKPTRTMPAFPKAFKYSAEVFDVMKTDPDDPEYTYDVEFQRVWYYNKRMLARLDKYTRTEYSSELYDFNTGVTYKIGNGRSCDIKPLRNSFFEAYDSQLIGHLKDPSEVLNLEGTFYYMGKRLMRGIWCDSFESVQLDVEFMKQKLSKLVISIFYSQDYYEVVIEGESETRIPIYYMVTGYDTKGKKVINLQYNIFEFDDVMWPDIYTSFRLGRCFPSLKDKSYFVLLMNVGEELARKMEAQDDVVLGLVERQIVTHAKVSEMRIALLTADYKASGVTVTGLMLDRPPAIKQFYKEFEGEVEIADKFLKPVILADTSEKCAYYCVDNDDFTCMGFYWCNNACFLKSKGLFEKKEEGEKTVDLGESCQTWIRVTRDSSNDESYLVDALKSLENAVLDQKVKIAFQLDEKTEKIIPIEQIAIGDGPYTGTGQDKPYDIVINFAKLDKDYVSTTVVDYVDNLNDCYKACKASETTACASFSYCGRSANKQCMLSTTLYVDRKKNPDGLKDDQNCYVYSMKYLDLYEAYPGRVSLLSGDDVYTVGTLEECARKCQEDTKIKCRGFEFCRSTKSCVLHSKHILDLKPGEVAVDKKSPCVHYAAKFSIDYDDMGYTLLDDKTDERFEISLEECAKTCSEELKSNCKSFNYCPPSQPYATDSSCAISSKILKDGGTTTSRDKCHHYEKKQVNDWKKTEKKSVPEPSGYTAKGFTGLVIGMLALGLIVGAIGFVGYSYYKSRSSGDGMTVRFMKQPT